LGVSSSHLLPIKASNTKQEKSSFFIEIKK